jgi:hypothetical protein
VDGQVESYGSETLINEQLQELRGSSAENEDDEHEEPATWNQHTFAEVIQVA